jgi:glyoxylase-like metal-dependent hydrolase (beta-lactamase superfamily II)
MTLLALPAFAHALDARQLALAAILVTHHHVDHDSGAPAPGLWKNKLR